MACFNTKARCLDTDQSNQTTGEVDEISLTFASNSVIGNVSAIQLTLFAIPPTKSTQSDPRAERDMMNAREWINAYPDEWATFCKRLHRICKTEGRAVERALIFASEKHRKKDRPAAGYNNDIRAALTRIYLADVHPEDAPHLDTRKSRADNVKTVQHE